MKTLILLFSFFLLSNSIIAQTHKIIQISSACKVGEFPLKKLFTIVAMGEDSIPAILNLIKNSKRDHSYLIHSLSFFNPTMNDEYNEVLDSLVLKNKVPLEVAQRIGGTPFEKFLENFFSIDRTPSYRNVLTTAWMVHNFNDFKTLERHAKNVLENHPDWKLYKYISITYIHNLEIIRSVFENGNNDIAFNLLADLMENGNSYFSSGQERYLFAWALKRFYLTDFDKTKKVNFLKKLKNKRMKYGVNYLTESLIFYLSLLGEQPNEEEIKGLKKYLNVTPTQNFASTNELIVYYDFCKRYRSLRVY
ncbi:MAG: hypothetical protein AB8F94_23005 [Saprospiraceae bacterium]